MGNENSTFSFFRFVSGSKKAVARRVRNHLPPLHFLQYDMSTLQRRTCCPIELWLVDWGNIHHTHLGSFHPGEKRQALDLAPPRQDHGIVENGRVAGTSLGLTWRSWSFLGSSYQVGIRWSIRSTTRLVLRAVIVKGGAELELAWSVYFPSLILSSFPRRVSGLSLTDFVLLLLHIETEPVEVFSATGLDFSWQSSIIALPIVPTGGSVAVAVSNANMWTCCFSTSSTAHLHQIIPRLTKTPEMWRLSNATDGQANKKWRVAQSRLGMINLLPIPYLPSWAHPTHTFF